MRSWMMAFAVGITLAAALPFSAPEQSLWWGLACATLCLASVLSMGGLTGTWCRVSRTTSLVLGASLAAAAGLCWVLFRSALHAAAVLPERLESVDFWATGTVVSPVRDVGRYQQFSFQVEADCFQLRTEHCPRAAGHFGPALVQLNDYTSLPLEAGQRWQLRLRLRQPRGTVNPGAPDREVFWFREGVKATGYVRETSLNRKLPGRGGQVAALRQGLLKDLERSLPGSPEAALIRALAVGDRDAISDAQWQRFRQTGTNHLVVISGLHVGFLATLVFFLIRWVWSLVPGLPLWCPAQKAAAVAAILAAVLYALLAGFSLPTRRALIMVTVFMTGRLLGLRMPVSLGLTLSLFLVLLLDPLAVASAGFWLSFTAVAALLLGYSARHRHPGPHESMESGGVQTWISGLYQRWLKAQCLVFIALVAPLAFWMGEVSLLAPLANILAIPLISLFVVPLSLAGVLLSPVQSSLAAWCWQLAARGVALLEWGLEKLLERAASLAILSLDPPLWPALVLAACAAAVLLMPAGWPGRWFAPMLSLPLFLSSAASPEKGTAAVTVLDVGQGLAVVVRTRQHTLLFDTGPGSGDSDTARFTLLPYLQYRARSHIDTLIVSHWHADHHGGLATLLGNMSVQRLLLGSTPGPAREQSLRSRLSQEATWQVCRSGMQWQWDGVEFRILHPAGEQYANENDNSCVLQIRAGEQTLLLTGDVEMQAEAALVARHNDALASTVLLVPHHGSRSSSGGQFLDRVAPELALVSTGYRNRFDHPHESVRLRYASLDIPLWNTAPQGALSLVLGAEQEPDVIAWREQRRRYWRRP